MFTISSWEGLIVSQVKRNGFLMDGYLSTRCEKRLKGEFKSFSVYFHYYILKIIISLANVKIKTILKIHYLSLILIRSRSVTNVRIFSLGSIKSMMER